MRAVATIVLSLVVSPVLAATFSSSCDRFEVDGNAFGAQDGTIDFSDDFTGGTLAPNWSILLGSANEAGTDLVVHDPGTSIQLGPTLFQISTVENTIHGIGNGEGNGIMTSYWEPTLPVTDSELHMQLYSQSPIIEAAGLSVNNFSSQVAMEQGNGALAGYSVSQSLTHGFGSGFTTVQSDSVAFNAGDVTGEIVLRMSIDDATDMVTSSFSLDGGTTFQSPFPALHIFNGGVVDYDILLGAAALVPNSPPPPPADQFLPLSLLVVKNPSGLESRRVTYKAVSPRSQGNYIVGNPTSGGATLKIRLDSVTQCFSMPAIGWSRYGPSYRYLDQTGAYGPVKVAQWRQTSSGAIQNKVTILGKNGTIDVVPPGPGVQADANFHVGGGAAYCASTAGGTIAPNDAKTFKAKSAPAPAACNVTACP